MVIRNDPIGIQEKVNTLHDYCAEIFVQLISAIFSTTYFFFVLAHPIFTDFLL